MSYPTISNLDRPILHVGAYHYGLAAKGIISVYVELNETPEWQGVVLALLSIQGLSMNRAVEMLDLVTTSTDPEPVEYDHSVVKRSVTLRLVEKKL